MQDNVPHLRSFGDWVRHIMYGLCIGAADIVPGFSGGTMALILGIYENLIYAIKSFSSSAAFAIFKLRVPTFLRGVSWDFLLALVLGIACSLATLSQVVHHILGHEVYRVYLYALFLGMIAASMVILIKRLNEFKLWQVIPLCFGVFVAFLLTETPQHALFEQKAVYDVSLANDVKVPGFSPSKPIQNYEASTNRLLGVSEATLSAMLARGEVDFDATVYNRESGQVSPIGAIVEPKEPAWIIPWFILCGAIAISAMLLPGISGSYMLMILGAFPIVVEALADLVNGLRAFTFDLDAFLILANLGSGFFLGRSYFPVLWVGYLSIIILRPWPPSLVL